MRKTGARIGLADGLAHEVRPDGSLARRHMPGEDHPVLGLGPLVAQVQGDGAPCCVRQGHYVFTPALGAAQCDRAGFPVDVVQVQVCDLAASHAQVERAAHNRVGAQHRRAALTKGGFELFDLCRLQRLGQRCQLPVGRVGQSTNQRMGTVAQRRAPAEVAAQGRDHGAQARRCAVVLGLQGEEVSYVLGREDLEPDVAITEVLAKKGPDQAKRALAGLRGKSSDLCHVLVVATQLLPDCRLVLWLGPDGTGLAQHDQKVCQCSAHASWVTRTRLAVALGKMALEELDHERLIDVGQTQVGLVHPHRKVHHGRFAAAHIAGDVAATEQVLAVCRNMPLQMSTAARADRGFGSRRKLGSHGSLQVVEPPVNMGRKTMCSCSRPNAPLARVIADQMPSRQPRLYIVESYA